MAKYTISQFTMPDGNILELKDKVAREAIQGGSHFLGVTSTEITDGASTTTLSIGGESVTAANGDIVVYGVKEFIYASSDSKWHELGDVSMLGALAVKDSASGSYTPAGTVTFTGASMTSSGSYTPAGSVSFTGGTVNSTGSYTPAGSVSKPDVDVTETSVNIAEFDNAGSVSAGTAAVLPTLSFTPDASTENLTITWTAGTTNTPTSVTLPTSKTTAVLSGVSAELHATPSFTGTEATLEVSGTAAGSASFTGTAATIEVEGTTTGSASFSGTTATITVE